MLKKMILKNFKTFKNETIIDFEATKFKGIIKNNVCDGVVKGGVILGSNAVGKSSILDSIKLLLTMLFSDKKVALPLFVCMFGDSDETRSTILRASSESPRETQNYEKMYLGGVFGRRTKYGKNSD